MSSVKQVCLAEVRGAVGIRGEVRLASYVEDPASLRQYGELESHCGRHRLRVRSLRRLKKGFAARLEGVEDRDAALALQGTRLCVPRNRLPELDEDEHYHVDLVGLAVEDGEGHPVGRVAAVHDFGAGDLLEIAPESGGPTEMVPFTRESVPQVETDRIVLATNPFVAATGDG